MRNPLIFFIAFILISFTSPSYAGFLSQFFANVASDSLKNNGKSGQVAADPVIREKKMQGALGAMGYYHQFPDGDLNTFESRIGIKKFQEFLGAEPTGMLLDNEKEQLLYLSNLYTELKKADITSQKQYAVYDEIDATIDSMRNKPFYEEYLDYFDSSETLRIISNEEDANVYINTDNVGQILLGYFTLKLEPGEYAIKVEKFTEDGEWQLTATKNTQVKENLVNIVELALQKSATKQRQTRITAETAKAKLAEEKELTFLKKQGIEYSINADGTVTDVQNSLVWMRCALDQKWNAYTCIADSTFKNIDQAFNAKNAEAASLGEQKWRIPTITELKTLVYCSSGKPTYRNLTEKSCEGSYQSPTIAQAIFPQTSQGRFWSSTVVQDFMFRSSAKFINFDKGYVLKDSSGKNSKVRLVKSLMTQVASGADGGKKQAAQFANVFHDQLNHLVWEDSSQAAQQKLYFSKAKAHCADMASTSANLWRLPTNGELAALFPYQYANIQIKYPHHFRYGQHYLMSNIEDFGYDFKNQGITKLKSSSLHFRCVYNTQERDSFRATVAEKYSLPRYTNNFVIDSENHLAWENNIQDVAKRYSPSSALEKCANLDIDGIKGWQVPDSKQLRSFFKEKPSYSTATVVSDEIGFLSIKRDYAYKLNNKGEKTEKTRLEDNSMSANLICVKPLTSNH